MGKPNLFHFWLWGRLAGVRFIFTNYTIAFNQRVSYGVYFKPDCVIFLQLFLWQCFLFYITKKVYGLGG
jgi:hypothetical protein